MKWSHETLNSAIMVDLRLERERVAQQKCGNSENYKLVFFIGGREQGLVARVTSIADAS